MASPTMVRSVASVFRSQGMVVSSRFYNRKQISSKVVRVLAQPGVEEVEVLISNYPDMFDLHPGPDRFRLFIAGVTESACKAARLLAEAGFSASTAVAGDLLGPVPRSARLLVRRL